MNESTCKRSCFRCKGRHHSRICVRPSPKNIKKKEEEEPEYKKEDSNKNGDISIATVDKEEVDEVVAEVESTPEERQENEEQVMTLVVV